MVLHPYPRSYIPRLRMVPARLANVLFLKVIGMLLPHGAVGLGSLDFRASARMLPGISATATSKFTISWGLPSISEPGPTTDVS